MLTSIFYYQHYKPYIVKEANPAAPIYQRSKVSSKDVLENSESASFILNNALIKEVVDYIQNVSSGVNGVKDTARKSAQEMEDLNKNTEKWGFEKAKEWINQDLTRFVEAYNHSVSFLGRQSHSRELNYFSAALADSVEENQISLSSLGIALNESSGMSYTPDYFTNLTLSDANRAIGENIHLFRRIYNEANSALSAPLTEHMKFKNLGFYYNYKYGTIQADSYKIIESGLLVDIAV